VKREIRQQARTLRQEGVSVRTIAKTLSVSTGSVSEWVRDIVLSEEQILALKESQSRYANQLAGSRVNQEKSLAKRISYQQTGREKVKEHRPLHLIGCMLYWAEGAKTRNGIYFANSDPNMTLLFMRFLREELNVRDESVKLLIHCHSSDPAEIHRIEQYWANLLRLPLSALNKTQIKKGSNTRKNILENGVCSIRVYSTELTHHIYGAIQEYGGFDNPDWLF
jgi:predicted transcriptional regulator